MRGPDPRRALQHVNLSVASDRSIQRCSLEFAITKRSLGPPQNHRTRSPIGQIIASIPPAVRITGIQRPPTLGAVVVYHIEYWFASCLSFDSRIIDCFFQPFEPSLAHDLGFAYVVVLSVIDFGYYKRTYNKDPNHLFFLPQPAAIAREFTEKLLFHVDLVSLAAMTILVGAAASLYFFGGDWFDSAIPYRELAEIFLSGFIGFQSVRRVSFR